MLPINEQSLKFVAELEDYLTDLDVDQEAADKMLEELRVMLKLKENEIKSINEIDLYEFLPSIGFSIQETVDFVSNANTNSLPPHILIIKLKALNDERITKEVLEKIK